MQIRINPAARSTIGRFFFALIFRLFPRFRAMAAKIPNPRIAAQIKVCGNVKVFREARR
jgi:hypothetical protein